MAAVFGGRLLHARRCLPGGRSRLLRQPLVQGAVWTACLLVSERVAGDAA